MKKLRSAMQLELEQAKLKLHEAALEKAIKKDWKQLKESLQPTNLGKEIFSKAAEKFKTLVARYHNKN
jgi:hypothetical protein